MSMTELERKQIESEKLFTGHGIEIEKRGEHFFLIYDAGEVCDRMEVIQISEEEAEVAQRSSMDAYNIIIKYQNEMTREKGT